MTRPLRIEIDILQTRWALDAERLSEVRRRVFVREQGVPKDLEWDGRDHDAIHLIAVRPPRLVLGTARLLKTGQIGRISVLPDYRRLGIGTRLLTRAIELSHEQSTTPWLDAQLSVVAFYLRNGFERVGERFVEAGIPHIRMVYHRHGA